MKVLIVVSAFICAAAAIPQDYYQQQSLQQAPIPILKSNSDVKADGSYQFEYETGNGIQAAENGYLKNAGIPGAESQVVQGYYQYIGPEGIPVQLSYTADENGFHPIGNHLPTPPPVPVELEEAYARVLADPASRDGDDGQYRPQQYQG